jgi:hypothetical protein
MERENNPTVVSDRIVTEREAAAIRGVSADTLRR